MRETLQRLTRLWHDTIPLSRFMGIEAVSFVDGVFTTRADQAANKNLHNTMFAGSIYSHAALTGWGRVWLALEAAGLEGDIVLAEGNIRYRRPVHDLPECHALPLNPDLTPLAEGRNARVTVTVSLAGRAEFVGQFVVMAKRSAR
ncbi:YiiD C-terminal domain-containing protein [Ferrimonas marina]|uniref:Thioesterase domain-containing protein, putative n=1 Tax=Ferrimonas marina TaxID=299255 RepID=A0A1M5ZAG5_9GAMM|nr:YiiD C-terminal domain-containing protein [Ferrimonas marina]SHI21217.1 thioesterase domain-containing protein, putative [Ferrimonas marina]